MSYLIILCILDKIDKYSQRKGGQVRRSNAELSLQGNRPRNHVLEHSPAHLDTNLRPRVYFSSPYYVTCSFVDHVIDSRQSILLIAQPYCQISPTNKN